MINNNRKGLFVFSDPGGAKPILSFIKIHNIKEFVVISDRSYQFYDLFEIDVKLVKKIDLDFLDNYKPDYIFSGTSYTSSLELEHLSYAKINNIESFAYVDHYSKINERFNHKDLTIYPNHICLIDNYAKKLAIKLKMDGYSNLHVIGNYYLKFLNNWTPDITKEMLFNDLKINTKQKTILFVPDPISNLDWKLKYNFDEVDLWNLLSLTINEKNNDVVVLIKMHPNQNVKYLKSAIENQPVSNVIFLDEKKTMHCFCHTDLIIGIFSSILIEANIFNKKIIRFVPKGIEDFLKSKDVGILFRESEKLTNYIKKTIYVGKIY